MGTSQISNLINEYSSLSFEDKKYVVELLQKQLNDCKREEIRNRADEAIFNMNSGKSKSGNLNDLFADIEND
jgi:hypothetical protein